MRKLLILITILLSTTALFSNGQDSTFADTPTLNGSLNTIYIVTLTPKGKSNETFAKLSPGDVAVYFWCNLTKDENGDFAVKANYDTSSLRTSPIPGFNYGNKIAVIKKAAVNRTSNGQARLIQFNYHISELVGSGNGVSMLAYQALMKTIKEHNLSAGTVRVENLSIKSGRVYGAIAFLK